MSVFTTRVCEGADARLEIDAAELRVVSGPDRGAKFELGCDSLLIGSASDCDIVLHDSTVSAKHAEIVATSTGYSIRDLQSTNGTFVGSLAIERVPLADGMRIRLGESALAVRSLKVRTSIPLRPSGEIGDLVAHSVKMRALVATLERIAPADVTVLIEGESGSGKEVVARALHSLSTRAHAPFVIFDCGAVNRSLAAAELFGAEKGAFTGATETRLGLFEEADGGTLFIDEIGELPLDLQPLLLSAIDRKVTRRVGGRADLRHDVRIVAATNRNLGEEVRAKRFRQDLFFRLNVARIRVPPLRERAEDLPLLANQLARSAGTTLSPELLMPLSAYDWPGNVRELRNVIARLAVDPDSVRSLKPAPRAREAAGLPDPVFDTDGRLRTLAEVRSVSTEAIERRYLEEVLSRARGNLSQAAELAGITRQSLTYLALKHGLHPRDKIY